MVSASVSPSVLYIIVKLIFFCSTVQAIWTCYFGFREIDQFSRFSDILSIKIIFEKMSFVYTENFVSRSYIKLKVKLLLPGKQVSNLFTEEF